MTPMSLNADSPLARHVRAPSLIPSQQRTPLKLLKKVDCYQQHCLKYPGLAVFHSYAEFIHWLLLEAEAAVTVFVPQPFQLRVMGHPYFPDAYLVRDGQPCVVELRAQGQMDARQQAAVTAFFHQHDWPFVVIRNEDVLKQETLALNWLPLIQVLVAAARQGLDTQRQEWTLLEQVLAGDACRVGDVLDAGRREEQALLEVALYRLLHRHKLACDLTGSPLDFDSVLQPC